MDLSALKYAVCALGDRSFPYFAQCGKDFDTALKALGAQAVVEQVECDDDLSRATRHFRFVLKYHSIPTLMVRVRSSQTPLLPLGYFNPVNLTVTGFARPIVFFVFITELFDGDGLSGPNELNAVACAGFPTDQTV